MAQMQMHTPRPRLLYLSPVIPATTGNGLAMRASMVIQLLARHYRVSLLVIRLYAPFEGPIPPDITSLCDRSAAIPVSRAMSPSSSPPLGSLRKLIDRVRLGQSRPTDEESVTSDRPFGGARFDVVHVFRLAMLPFARLYIDQSRHLPKRHLDLDDIESITRRRLSELYESNGHETMARYEAEAARRAEVLEADAMRDFDRLYVCSVEDRALLVRAGGAKVCVLPNALPLQDSLPLPPENRPFTFLFVGTLGYYPNEDAARFFCTEVLPLIRRAIDRDVQFMIVGSGATPAVRQLAASPDIRLVGPVPDVAPAYREANAVVVPIRAGGGTRIKVLEAFSYRRPVVATSIGVEGIAARPDVHFLLGNTAAELADQCVRLMRSSSLAERLIEAAHALFCRAYTVEAAALNLISCIAETSSVHE
jgi:glycosyltransferase involved in cell wall biosynthesis